MKRFAKAIPLILFIVTVVSYMSIYVPPDKIWFAGIISYSILPLVILNLILLIVLIIIKSKLFLWPLLGFIFGFFFMQITFKLNVKNKDIRQKENISILSFNSDFFQMIRKNGGSSSELMNWIINDSSKIKCIQEYKSSINIREMNFDRLMTQKGFENYSYIFQSSNGNQYGMATFSRYPIIDSGNILFNKKSKNNCIYIDIIVAYDTIRIYNVHLSSMSIPKFNKSYLFNYGTYLKTVFQKLKDGSVKHSNEINLLISHTSQCPYKFIICGDFNEIPYSYNYLKLRKLFDNSFEKAGSGFGFSFNGRRLFFLRIDHHFVSEGIRPIIYRVDHTIRKSGHFPTRGIYEIL